MRLFIRLREAWRDLFETALHDPEREHRPLATLDPRLLDDIGISLEQAEELDKRDSDHQTPHRTTGSL
jgi:uncharacterized protein YjiS (DUF1127 family)